MGNLQSPDASLIGGELVSNSEKEKAYGDVRSRKPCKNVPRNENSPQVWGLFLRLSIGVALPTQFDTADGAVVENAAPGVDRRGSRPDDSAKRGGSKVSIFDCQGDAAHV